MKILVIIPAFNEEKSILSVANQVSGCYDYIIINDASTDGTARICRENGLHVINLRNNLGIGGAMQTGYKYALKNEYDIAVQFDGDGQHMASEITKLIEKMGEADIVIGSRWCSTRSGDARFRGDDGEGSTKLRRVGIGFFTWLIKVLTGEKITDPTSGFRAINKKVIEVFANKYPSDYPEPETIILLAKNKYKIEEVSVEMRERISGKSSINWVQSIYYMFKVTIACLFARGEKI